MQDEPPLVVDLDGTLIKSDMLLETLVGVIRRGPWLVFLLPFWLMRGRAELKRELALRTHLSPDKLPYRAEVLRWIDEERGRGRRLVLATASDEKIARGIADHLGTFDDVLASNGRENLKGAAKRDALVERFGERGFDYAGDEAADLPVWSAARRAIVVGNDAGLAAAAGRAATESQTLAVAGPALAPLARALRIQQWPKNLLVFVPLVTSHSAGDAQAWFAGFLAFAAFCCAASAIYIVNDLVDLQSDRVHARKRSRPFAAGDLGIGWGIALLPLLLGAAIAIALQAGPNLALAVGAYAIATVMYSMVLKRIAIVDIVMIAAFLTLREVGGAVAIGVEMSDWLLAFSMALFVSVALAKRHAELHRAADAGLAPTARLPGRGYRVGDQGRVEAAGGFFGLVAVVVLALYITHPQVTILYSRPAVLWLADALLAVWLARVWHLAHRGKLGEDPLSFALHDAPSYGIALLTLLAVYAAT